MSELPAAYTNLTFEEAFTRLQQTVQKLEAGNLSLEEATRLYEDGMGLAKACSEKLDQAELKVTRLQQVFAEQMKLIRENGGDA